jgi:hypothetical protein
LKDLWSRIFVGALSGAKISTAIVDIATDQV